MFTYQPVVLIDNVRLNILFIEVKHTYDFQIKSSILKEFFLIKKIQNVKLHISYFVTNDINLKST